MRSRSGPRPGDLFLAALLLAAFGCGAGPRDVPARSDPAPQAAPPPSPSLPSSRPAASPDAVPRGYAGALPPLPSVAVQPARPPDVVHAVYAFAARHPEVLHHVPCFCGCERQGHRGNDDCFVAARDAAGRPRWEMHGYV